MAGITGVHHHGWPSVRFLFQIKLFKRRSEDFMGLSLEFGYRHLITYINCKVLLNGATVGRTEDRECI